MQRYDVIVIGGGHAGCEAASSAARRGARTLLLTFDRGGIGAMSCNPAIGGLGKGHLVREVDAFDGLIARAADQAAIHYRMLNARKGTAVRGPRVQADRKRYKAAIQQLLARHENLTVAEGEAGGLILNGGAIAGVTLTDGRQVAARSVILAAGTFLRARMFRGEEREEGGRVGERAATALGQQLQSLGLPLGRLKTGTPPRLDGRSIDWAALEAQPSDEGAWTMSPLSAGRSLPQVSCAITRTTARTHDVIREALDRSPLYSGAIEGRGPRYCPSIEDKVLRFGDRDGHQIFLEPEGLDDPLVYPNGISTSLPAAVQESLIRTIAGLQQARITVPGYAVEYDHVDPRVLQATLMVADIPGLFCCGQVNGTTGYEEAAAQGLVAGANASAHALDIEPLVLSRADSYIGVMIDDLTLQGVTEPYRMLTARAEYRLRLRADNASTRLTPLGLSLNLIGEERARWFDERSRSRRSIAAELEAEYSATAMARLGAPVRQDGSRRTLMEWARFPEVTSDILKGLSPAFAAAPEAVGEELLEDARYAPYLERQSAEIETLARDTHIVIPDAFDFSRIGGLSTEMIERLSSARPPDLGAASRIRGITPAALSAIWVGLKRSSADLHS